MIYKTIPYKDYADVEHEKTFFFSLNQAEFTVLNGRLPGGLDGYITKMVEDRDPSKIVELLMMFIVEGYGIRESDDDFIKEDPQGRKLGLRFKCSEACDNLIMELLKNDNSIWEFIIGMLPKSAQAKAQAAFDDAMARKEKEDNKVVALPTSESGTPNT